MDEGIADAFIGECLNLFFLAVPKDQPFDPQAAMTRVLDAISIEGIDPHDVEQLKNYCREAVPAALEEDKLLVTRDHLAMLTLHGQDVWDTMQEQDQQDDEDDADDEADEDDEEAPKTP